MKNVSTLFIALSLVTLAGCPGDDGGSDGTETATPTTMTGTAGDDDGTPTSTAGDDDGVDDGVDTTAGMDDGVDDGVDDGGAMVCMHTCAADEDCQAAGGTDIGFICEGGACANGNPCTDDASCVPQLSGWAFVPCTAGGGECDAAMQVCVDLGDGTGGCATPPSEFVMCETIGQEEVEVTDIDGNPATVCGNTSGVCNTDTGFCSVPCVDDTTCGTLTCDTASGNCVCTEDAQCGEGLTCNTDTGACEGGGCMEDADCTNPFNGGTVTCG
jgi:hypothetical protein